MSPGQTTTDVRDVLVGAEIGPEVGGDAAEPRLAQDRHCRPPRRRPSDPSAARSRCGRTPCADAGLGLVQRGELDPGPAAFTVQTLQQVPGDVLTAHLPVGGLQLGQALVGDWGAGVREDVESGDEVGVGGCQVGAGGLERVDEGSGVVQGEGRVELTERKTGGARKVSQSGDLAGYAAQVGGVVAGPGSHGAVGGPALAGGLDALFAGGSSRAGPVAQVAALGSLAAGDTQGAGEVGPAGACTAGRFDHSGFPPGELLTNLSQQQKGGQGLLRVIAPGGGRTKGFVLGGAQGVADDFQSVAAARNEAGLWASAVGEAGWSAIAMGTSPSVLSSFRRHRACHPLDDMLQRFSEAHWQVLPEPCGGVSRC